MVRTFKSIKEIDQTSNPERKGGIKGIWGSIPQSIDLLVDRPTYEHRVSKNTGAQRYLAGQSESRISHSLGQAERFISEASVS